MKFGVVFPRTEDRRRPIGNGRSCTPKPPEELTTFISTSAFLAYGNLLALTCRRPGPIGVLYPTADFDMFFTSPLLYSDI